MGRVYRFRYVDILADPGNNIRDIGLVLRCHMSVLFIMGEPCIIFEKGCGRHLVDYGSRGYVETKGRVFGVCGLYVETLRLVV